MNATNINITKREQDVLALLAQDKTSKETGAQLGISHKTVEAHRENIKKKTGIEGLAGLTKLAIKLNLATIE